MVQATPDGEPQLVSYNFRYEIADQFVEDALDEEGIEVTKFWTIAFELRDLPNRDLRRRARAVADVYMETPGWPALPAPTEDPVAFIKASEEWINEAHQKLEMHQTDERGAIQQAEIFESERSVWVRQFGSRRLQRALERGYKVNRLYAQERVSREFRQYWLDTSGDAQIQERTDPTEQALDLEDVVREEVALRGIQMETRIVWLAFPPAELASRWDVPELEWEPQEAIMVLPYLGRYRLFLPVDTALWRSDAEIGPVDG